MGEHTPGPWWPDYRTASIGCGAGWIVGTEWHDQKSDEEFGDIEDDMRLVAAAPELLAACEAVLALAEKNDDPEMSEESLEQMAQEAADRIRAAIAKAKGE